MSQAGECRIVSDNFVRQARSAGTYGEQIVADATKQIESDVKARWGFTKLPIFTLGGGRKRSVVVGSEDRFYARFLEYGTRYMAAQKAMVPAAERARDKFMAQARRLERGMR